MSEEKIFYLTKQGFERFKKEHQKLKELKLSKIKGELPGSLCSDDANSEHFIIQEDINFIETKLKEIENILKNAELIKLPPKEKQNIINLGATVLVEVNGQTDEFEIVGTLEADPAAGKISNESPVGRALLGHRVGDSIVMSSPVKTIFKIKKIKYYISRK
jgi:transcription elongation factor GreA